MHIHLGFFKIGTNELRVDVENLHSVTGLLVSAKLAATCGPPPPPFDPTIRKTAVNLPWTVGSQDVFRIQALNLGPGTISQGTVEMENLLQEGFSPPFTITQSGSLWNSSTTPVGQQYKVSCTWPTNIQTVSAGTMPLIAITGTFTHKPLKNCADVKLTGSFAVETNLTNNTSCVGVN